MSDFSYEVVNNFAVLSNKKGYTKEFNLISYNGKPAVYDIRTWFTDEDTKEKKMTKGITLTKEELMALKDAINKIV